MNALSEFEDELACLILLDGFNNVINGPTILQDKFILPKDMFNNLVESIRNGTASIVLDLSFDAASPIISAGFWAVILATSTECHERY